MSSTAAPQSTQPNIECPNSDLSVEWLNGLAEKGGKGVVGNIDARSLGRVAGELEDWKSSHASLKARVEELEAALRPFAKFADRFGLTAREDGWQITQNPSGTGNLTMGDCRNARAAFGQFLGVARGSTEP